MEKEIKRTYHSNGQLRFEIPYVNGKWHGLKKWSYMNGSFWYKVPFKNDLQHGARVVFQY